MKSTIIICFTFFQIFIIFRKFSNQQINKEEKKLIEFFVEKRLFSNKEEKILIEFFVQKRLLTFRFSKVSYFESSVSSPSFNGDLARKKLFHCLSHQVQRYTRVSLSRSCTWYIRVPNLSEKLFFEKNAEAEKKIYLSKKCRDGQENERKKN